MATSVSTIKGMTPDLAAKLKEQGITNTDHLLEASKTASARRALAQKVGVENSVLLELVNRADLSRIKGIGDAYANLLEEAGVDSVKELAHRTPANLHDKLVQVNTEKKTVPRPPSLDQVTTWVDEAKAMGQTVQQ